VAVGSFPIAVSTWSDRSADRASEEAEGRFAAAEAATAAAATRAAAAEQRVAVVEAANAAACRELSALYDGGVRGWG
jgi:hypothetical protein